ncbi:Nonsense-mediated mRNA decay protein, partial [Spraguea lophii 42_110]
MNCCFCGISLLTNTTSTPFLCIRCSSLNKKLSDTIKTHETLTHCRGCDRYLCPPKKWIELEWLSIDMMQMLLKRKNDIKKYKINESIFLKSEKTSRRFILKLNISYNPDEVHNDNISTTLYDTVLIQYRLTNKQCSDCEKREAKQYWNYIVQVRQKTLAKYNIYQLEHKIIGSHNDILHATSNIKSRKDGIDFYYLNKIEAKKMIKYLENI